MCASLRHWLTGRGLFIAHTVGTFKQLLLMMTFLRHCITATTLALAALGAHAQAYVNATVGGEWAPGVYGRINIGNAPPPPLLYPQPVLIQPPAVVVPRSPIYLYVPPGHAKNWGKHCARYNACAQPVYFVKEPRGYAQPRGGKHRFDDDDHDDHRKHRGGKHHDRDHDRGYGRGHGRD